MAITTPYGNHIQRTGQCDHNGTEHCPKDIKYDQKQPLPDETWTGPNTTKKHDKKQSPQTRCKVNN